MRTLKTLLILALGVPLLAGCDDPLDLDINTDPNAATEVPGDNLMPFIQATISANRAIEFGQSTTIFSQIWVSNGSTGVFTDPERYTISSNTTGNAWFAFYNGVLKNLGLMRDQALDADPQRVNVAAQAELLSAYTFWMLTALWGDIPFTEALDANEFPNPNFDEQETVLRGLVDQIDAGLALIDLSPDAGPGVESGDLIYGGDMDLWERFGNSLKLRILMMIRNRDASVDAEIQSLLSQPLVRENAHEAAIPFFDETNNENNLWKVCSLFSAFEGNGCVWFAASETLVDEMDEVGDPRRLTYFEPSPFTGETEVFGQTPGVFDFGDETALLSRNIVREDWPSRMITAAEIWLFEAEFLASQGDLGGAHDAFVTGVERGLDFFDGKPGDVPEADETAYLESLPQNFSSQDGARTAIWRQQYIEVFDRSPENWTQWRRTHFPDLPLPQQAVLGDIIRRLPIPIDERSSNPNVPPVVDLEDPMWFEPQN